MNTQLLQVDPAEVQLPFHDREAAGRMLSERLTSFRGKPDVKVMALPRGGIPVGREVAGALDLPLDYLLVQKVCRPGTLSPVGAVAEGDVTVWSDRTVWTLPEKNPLFHRLVTSAHDELARRKQRYYGGASSRSLEGCRVILVDDGLETGISMRAAIEAARHQGAIGIIVAVPVASRSAIAMLVPHCDELNCLATPEPFQGIGQSYLHYAAISELSI